MTADMTRSIRRSSTRPAPSRRSSFALLVVTAIAVHGCTGTPVPDADSPGPGAGPGAGTDDMVTTPWEQARLRGVEFRAIGQEPGWNLDIDQGREIRYSGDYGDTRVTMTAPEPVIDSAGTIVYHARTDTHDLRVVIRESPCQDTMSGEAFTHSVTVVLDGNEVRGCGRVLMTGELTNTHWKLLTLQGAAALGNAPQRDPYIRLVETERRVVGSTGCNHMFGEYLLEGGRIRFANLGSTRMACVDPALAGQEQRFVQALESADSMAVARDTLTLFGGGRELARFGAVYPR